MTIVRSRSATTAPKTTTTESATATTAQTANSTIIVWLESCPRCGEAHPMLRFSALARPSTPINRPDAIPYTHWAECPKTWEPILYSPDVPKQSGIRREA